MASLHRSRDAQPIGQDIHGWVEVAWNPPHEWAAILNLDLLVERNPSLWTWLFQDQGWFPSVAAGRGLPTDASGRVQQETDILREVTIEGEVHSFTWAIWREIDAVDWSAPPLPGAPATATLLVGGRADARPRIVQHTIASRRDTLDASPGWILLFDLMRRLARDYGPDSVRVVVWFEG